MTSAEFRYLQAVCDLFDGKNGVKQTAIAQRMNVSKVSVYRAAERLEKNNYICRDEKNKIIVTETGYANLEKYTIFINWIALHLQQKGNIPQEIAYQDAINAVCAMSDETRNYIAGAIKNCMPKNHSK